MLLYKRPVFDFKIGRLPLVFYTSLRIPLKQKYGQSLFGYTSPVGPRSAGVPRVKVAPNIRLLLADVTDFQAFEKISTMW